MSPRARTKEPTPKDAGFRHDMKEQGLITRFGRNLDQAVRLARKVLRERGWRERDIDRLLSGGARGDRGDDYNDFGDPSPG